MSLQAGKFYSYKGRQVWLDRAPNGSWFALLHGTSIEARGATQSEALTKLRAKIETSAANYRRRHLGHSTRQPFVIFDAHGHVVSSSQGLAGVRRYASKHPMKSIGLVKLPDGGGVLRITFDNGAAFTARFADYTVLKGWVAHWRAARGVAVHYGQVPRRSTRRR